MNRRLISKEGLVVYPPLKEVLSGWLFTIDEVSPNVYKIQGVDQYGSSVSRTGSEVELEEIIIRCLYDASEIIRNKG